MKRAGQPAELAPVYVYLASQESSYVTAEVHGVRRRAFRLKNARL